MHLLERLEEHFARREWLHADREATRLAMMESLSDREMGRMYRMWGRAKAGLNELKAATTLLERALPHAMVAEDWDCVGCVRSELGTLYTSAGDLYRGTRYLRDYRRDLNRYQEEALAFQGKVSFNLGLACRYQKQYSDAILHYSEALAWFDQHGWQTEKGMTHQNLGWLHATIDQLPQAKAQLELADAHRESAPPAFDAEQLCCWALYHLKAGQVGSAMDSIQEVLLADRPGVTVHHRGQAALVGGYVAVKLGQKKEAERMLDLAMAAAIDTNNKPLADDCSELRSLILRQWPGALANG